MIALSPDSVAQTPRLTPAAPITPPALQPIAPVTPSAAQPAPALTADPLTLLLQSGAADPPESPLPAADLARRYAESGTLTQRAASGEVLNAPPGRLAPADTAILSNLSQAYRQTATATPLPQPPNVQRELANAQLPNAPATAGNTPAVIIVDGRSLPLNPAQTAILRSALASNANPDARLLTNVLQQSAQSGPIDFALSSASTGAVLMIDGRTFPLSAAQIAIVRANVAFRRIGPALGGSDSEDLTVTATQASADQVIVNSQKVASIDASSRPHTESPEPHPRPLPDDMPMMQAALGDNEKVEAVQAVRHEHPAPYEPELILPRPQDQVVIAPAPDRILLAGQQASSNTSGQPAITGIAVALAPGITRDDVTAELHQEGYRLSFAGSKDTLLLHASAGLSAQLVFADGTSMRLQLNHD